MSFRRVSVASDAVGIITPLSASAIAPMGYKDTILEDERTLQKINTPKDSKMQASKVHEFMAMHSMAQGGILDSDDTTATLDDTVHYMSPVSPLSARTAYEGDHHYLDYLQFMHPVLEDVSSYKTSSGICEEPELQRTIAIVKPDAMKYEDVIVRAITEAGFSQIDKRHIHFTPEQVSEFYSQYYGSPAFPHQVVSMSVGPVLVLSLADVGAVSKWRDTVGPDRVLREEWFLPMSMRIRFGLQEAIPNAVHASENLNDSYKENRYVFPRNILEPLINDINKVQDYCSVYVNPTLLLGLTDLVKVKPVDPIMYLAEWLLRHNPYQPQFSKDIALIPT